MARRPSLRSELEGLYDEAGVEGLRAVVVDEAEHFARRLGVGAHEIADLTALDDGAFATRLRELVERVERAVDPLARALELERQADAAATELALRARYRDGLVELDRALLLGPLLADPEKKIVTFDLGDAEVSAARRKLLEVRHATRGFPDLVVSVDQQALRLRWRGGRGGLNLRPLIVRPQDRVLERRVVLVSPTAEQLPVPAPRRANPIWLGDLLRELGTLT